MLRIMSLAAALAIVPVAAIAQAPAAVPAPAAAGAVSPDKVKCHRYTETGSLAKVHKECHTIAEWRQLADSGRADAREMIDRVTNSTGAR